MQSLEKQGYPIGLWTKLNSEYQKLSPGGCFWRRGRPQGHIMKFLASQHTSS